MHQLSGQKILLGVTGGIAAYKSSELIRRLRDAGCDVRVVMTSGAEAFVSALTFQALSGNPVHTSLLDPKAEAGMGHIELARWADRVVVAPASANFMARLAAGDASDLLSTLCLATTATISLAPAMTQQMWQAPATPANAQRLAATGIELIGPDSGDQACGEVGPGRMAEPAQIIAALANTKSGLLQNRKILITAGPTREAIDPVRYISNHSSGKMGFALASACARAGAQVTLVSGPVDLADLRQVTTIRVETCEQMLSAVMANIESVDCFIGTAAVADYRCAAPSAEKIKKSDERLTLDLVKNPDILELVSLGDKRPPLVVGFAAESNNLIANARQKLQKKALDMVVANDITEAGIGFGSDENAVTLVEIGSETQISKTTKNLVAEHLVEIIAAKL